MIVVSLRNQFTEIDTRMYGLRYIWRSISAKQVNALVGVKKFVIDTKPYTLGDTDDYVGD